MQGELSRVDLLLLFRENMHILHTSLYMMPRHIFSKKNKETKIFCEAFEPLLKYFNGHPYKGLLIDPQISKKLLLFKQGIGKHLDKPEQRDQNWRDKTSLWRQLADSSPNLQSDYRFLVL